MHKFWRFFAGLLVFVTLTLGAAYLVVHLGIARWKEGWGNRLLPQAVRLASMVEDLDYEALRRRDPEARKAAKLRLDSLLKASTAPRGPSLALFSVQHGARGPWLSLLAASGNAYAEPLAAEVEPPGASSQVVRAVARGEQRWASYPGTEQDETPQITAYAPVRARDGQVLAVLALDRDLVLGDEDLAALLWRSLPPIGFLALLLALWMARMLARAFFDPLDVVSLLYKSHQPVQPRSQGVARRTADASLAPPALLHAEGQPSPAAQSGEASVPLDPARGGDPQPPALQLPAAWQAELTPSPASPEVVSLPLTYAPINMALVLRARETYGAWQDLTPAEKRVAVYMSEALSNQGIAKTLNVEAGTVKKHLKSVYSKILVDQDGEGDDGSKRVMLAIRLLSSLSPEEREAAKR